MKLLDGKDLLFSSTIEEKPLLPHNLKELENDLIGNYFEQHRNTSSEISDKLLPSIMRT